MTREVRDLLSQVILEHLATGLKAQLQGGHTHWLSLHLPLNSQRNYFSQ